MGSSFLTVNSTWERYIDSTEQVYKGMEEGVKRRLIVDIKKGGKVEGCGEYCFFRCCLFFFLLKLRC